MSHNDSTNESPLLSALSHVAHLLPIQGPIGVFVHHNTLHAFEQMPFHEALLEGEKHFGGRPYLTEDAYHDHFKTGRIQTSDIEAAYKAVYGVSFAQETAKIADLITRGALRKLRILHTFYAPQQGSVPFLLHDGGALDAFHPAVTEAQRAFLMRGERSPRHVLTSLFEVAKALSFSIQSPPPVEEPVLRHQQSLRIETGVDIDDWTVPFMIRWASTFLDGGTAYWPLPMREKGFYAAVRSLCSDTSWASSSFARRVSSLFSDQQKNEFDAEKTCEHCLKELGVSKNKTESFLEALLAPVRGFAGMFNKLQHDADPHAEALPTLIDFVAVRLTLELAAVQTLATKTSTPGWAFGKWLEKTLPIQTRDALSDAFVLFQLFQLTGTRPARAKSIEAAGAAALLHELQVFGERDVRRVWQEAYELHYAYEVSGAIAAHPPCPGFKPRFQVITCLDEREESFRRHIEETDPLVETFGGAGFFGLPVDYRGIDDAYATARCPIVLDPDREIHERVHPDDVALLDRRKKRRRLLGLVSRELGNSSRMFMRGAVLNAFVGWLMAVPMALRVLFPRWSARVSKLYSSLVVPAPRTRLEVDPTPHHHDERMLLGMPESERIDRVAGFLENIGLTHSFSPLVVVLGHGSNSLNNPHESAHDCGACGGRHGGPNARLFAHLANEKPVREGLAKRGLTIPDETWFIGGEHDTCTDAVFFWDTEEIPDSHKALFDKAVRTLDEARAHAAHERCRRFDFAPWGMTPERALREVERRAAAFDEPRPEYGHATNAYAVVGRRSRTRGLFLDRRPFLISYNPLSDPKGDILTRTLAAVGPVCAGINLEYYFSSVDNEHYGCGTKLPHNITAGLGVMNGAGSDLRTGLPWQMVEIHEPLRLLMIIEQTKEALLSVLHRVPAVKLMVEKQWIRLAALEPTRGEISLLQPDLTFSTPITAPAQPLATVVRSAEYYHGHREHLRPAVTKAATVRLSEPAVEAA
ncbi:MAG: DUF2309 domain-containing protein [Polyangiaceae bacterium]|nr:DUF2309 domain-containing protein [Polyangiaceae bacterium]